MPFPTFSIKKDGKVVGQIRNGRLLTDDDDLIGMVNIGVTTSTGGDSRGGKVGETWEGMKFTLPGEKGFFSALITNLLDEGYEIPVWVTQMLAS